MSNETRWSWAQGSKVIGEWRRSGLSMSEFARTRGLGTQRLRYWRDRLEANGDEHNAGTQRFVPGIVVGAAASRISVHLPRGVVVEATTVGEVEPAWVAELVVALERA